jgi:hypothetical protein
MPPLFPPYANGLFRGLLTALFVLVFAVPVSLWLYMRTPDAHAQGVPVDQPIEFDHRHHVRDDQIDCYYCHGSAQRSAFAGVPATEVCMGCHSQVWSGSVMLSGVRESYFGNRPIAWNRVHALPDHVYFNHAAHVNKGVGCATCHGRVDRMARVYKAAPLTMGWCLDCHRRPEPNLRPLEFVTSTEWTPPPDDGGALGRKLAQEYRVRHLTACSNCHR